MFKFNNNFEFSELVLRHMADPNLKFSKAVSTFNPVYLLRDSKEKVSDRGHWTQEVHSLEEFYSGHDLKLFLARPEIKLNGTFFVFL